MTSLTDHARPISLEDLARELRSRIDARGFSGGPGFRKVPEQILVDHPECRGLVVDQDLTIAGDLDLDALHEQGFSTIAVMGSLVITGRILNANGETGPFLFVDGDLSVRQIVKGGGSLIVLGSLAAADVVFCDYNHGAFVVGGDITAPAIIANNQVIEAGGAIKGAIIGDEQANMRDMLIPEVFEDPADLEDEWPVGELIRERLATGLPILKSAA